MQKWLHSMFLKLFIVWVWCTDTMNLIIFTPPLLTFTTLSPLLERFFSTSPLLQSRLHFVRGPLSLIRVSCLSVDGRLFTGAQYLISGYTTGENGTLRMNKSVWLSKMDSRIFIYKSSFRRFCDKNIFSKEHLRIL